ncbi:MAG: hypothetical protein OIN85_01840 [Candidatus Methanoperedens sp.]|nr:hypothetical protein [Candidatus Methanoperedens sp.]
MVNENKTTTATGSTVISVNASAAGTISAIASVPGYAIVTTTLTVTGPNPLASWWVIVLIIAGGELVLFLITRCCPRESNCNKTTQSNNTGNSQSNNTANKSWDLECFCITPGMFISFSVVWISSSVWICGFSAGNFLLATLGAGVLGGIVLDIVVNKGEYILPTTAEDGIYLGVLYGAVVGFIIAITTISTHYPALTATDSLAVFAAAATVKGASEYASTDTLIKKKKKVSIKFNLGPDDKFKEGFKKSDKPKVEGAIPIKNADIEQVVHLKIKPKDKDNFVINKDIFTQKNPETKFQEFSDDVEINYLAEGDFEAWVSWDGNDAYDEAESIHKKFTVVKSE